MPELPEVKTVADELSSFFKNKTIINLELITKKSLKNISEEALNKINNEEIINIYQFGKHLIFETTNYNFILHLRMEGKFEIIKNKNDINLDHVILLINFEKTILVFKDHRKFATIHIFDKKTNLFNDFLNKFGKEPWNIIVDDLYQKIKNKKSPIKTILLDQSNISGLGNIYVDEVLYKSKIHPLTKGNLITKEELSTIVNNSTLILKEAIELKGTTIKTFHSINNKGEYQNKLMVHTKNKLPCQNCGTIIEKIKVNGRGTYYCPQEQKEKY